MNKFTKIMLIFEFLADDSAKIFLVVLNQLYLLALSFVFVLRFKKNTDYSKSCSLQERCKRRSLS